MLPCADIDDIVDFWTALGLEVVYRQTRPNPYVALEGHGFPMHYYGLDGHRPEASHSTCGIVVDSTQALFDELSAGLRRQYGRLPLSGYPRITRPRPRKNAGGLSGFSLVDPAGNWIRVMTGGDAETIVEERSQLHSSLMNAIVLADSKGDAAQAAKILRGAIGRAEEADPTMAEAVEFLAELDERLADPSSGT